MKNNNELFLQAYKELETTLSNVGTDYRSIEDMSNDNLEKNRLTICRQLRNYLSHNADSKFINISSEQVQFIEGMNKHYREQEDNVAKHLVKSLATFACNANDKCTDVLAAMSKAKATNFIVIDTNNYYVINIFDVSAAALQTKTSRIKDVRKMKDQVIFVTKDTRYDSIPNGYVLCTSDGTPSGKLLGMVI